MASRQTRGRQRIEMVKIKNEANLQVTFSKRRNSLFKKANELCTLTNAEVALIVFSPGQKPFSFGSPDVDSIIDRFQTQRTQSFTDTNKMLQIHRRFKLENLNTNLAYSENQLEAEKIRREKWNRLNEITQIPNWWDAQSEEISLEQLQEFKLAIEGLESKTSNQIRTARAPRAFGFSQYVAGPFGFGGGCPSTSGASSSHASQVDFNPITFGAGGPRFF